MSHPDSASAPLPNLSELLTRYLHQQASAESAGLGHRTVAGDVVPFEAVPAQPVEPRVAWSAALEVTHYWKPLPAPAFTSPPPGWADLVAEQPSVPTVPFCLGNYPQLVRDVTPLIEEADLNKLVLAPSTPIAVPSLQSWSQRVIRERDPAQLLLLLSALRLARQFGEAERLLQSERADMPAAWQPALANEASALAWHQGHAEKALQEWEGQAGSVPVLFNRGMATLFLGRSRAARTSLAQAVEQLPEESTWHHLGKLYLALAEMRG